MSCILRSVRSQVSVQQEYPFEQHEFNGHLADEMAINRPTVTGLRQGGCIAAVSRSTPRSANAPVATAIVRRWV